MDYAIPSRSLNLPLAKEGHTKPPSRRDPYDGLRPWSAITHGLGAALALVGTVVLLIHAARLGRGVWHLVSFSVYGASMVGLYTASTLYHSVNTHVRGRIRLRKYDHVSIYLLIAGTYTPVCLIALRGFWGWSLFGVIWALTAAGTALTLYRVDCPRWLTAGIYIAMGWLALIAILPIGRALGGAGLFWLLLGGVLYTVGGVSYALKWPGRNFPRFGCHEIFHLFILLGSAAHWLMMYQVVVHV